MNKLECGFARVKSIFEACLDQALSVLSEAEAAAYVDGANAICRLGRGEEPVLAYLEEMPLAAAVLGEGVINDVVEYTKRLAKTPNGRAIAPFLQGLGAVSRALESKERFSQYLDLVFMTMQRTTPKVHGIDSMYPSECLVEFLGSVPSLMSLLSLGGIKNWVEYGIKSHASDPDAQREYFSLRSADSQAILQRERHGTLFTDNERRLSLYLRGLWQQDLPFVPYSLSFDAIRKPVPYYDSLGIHLPDVYDDADGVQGIDRYRALLAHLCAHLRWGESLIADNLSPFQRLAAEVFEDSRVECLATREYPGLSALWKKLHPIPREGACPEGWSGIRHRLFMLSRALLDPGHAYTNPVTLEYEKLFREKLAAGSSSTQEMADLGVKYVAATRTKSDLSAKVYFEDTEVAYRDDNRLMWRFIEEGDEEVYENLPDRRSEKAELERLPPRLYPEWDHAAGHFRPDWVSVYEHLHARGDSAHIDRLLAKHAQLAKKIGRIIDLLKPQNRVRIRYQEDGSELDIDVAIRALIDFKCGAHPDSRINMNHRNDGRSIAVSLLLDLSASLADIPEGCSQSKLELSQEAVSLLAWAVERIGDPLAIGGFHSDTRHEVRYLHIKGYGEHWGEEVKGRIAAMNAGYSTRMGAAIRHAGHYLGLQNTEKRLLLVLTDGEPSDVDVNDPRHLIEDARVAVRELDMKGIYTYCISLDPAADEYVKDIFGAHYAVIDDVSRLPDRLPGLFMALTK